MQGNPFIYRNAMRRANTLFLFFFLSCIMLGAQTPLRTFVNDGRVKSLQVKVAGMIVSDPAIPLDGEEQLEVNFDVLGNGFSRYTYSVVHCNADWTPSIILPMEYMNGFQSSPIDDFVNSRATTTAYSNYRLFLPNEDVQLKLSGNYAIQVFDEAQPGTVLFTACFFVTESVVSIDTQIRGNTDIDMNRAHQQLDFTVNHKDFPIPHPLMDLKLYVYQNDRWDNRVTDLRPSAIQRDQLVYSHLRELIFRGGNEYRRMEFLSNQYNGMGVESVQFHNPYYHVTLLPDGPRGNRTYQYDQDQNGRFFVRCSRCSEPDMEADYYIVHFTLQSDKLSGGDVYLNGQFVNNAYGEESRMTYDEERGQYEKSLLLKQGSYNYQYLFVSEGESVGQTLPFEGDFSQTENEYTIAVYYRPIGQRYDRLIGFTKVANRMTVF